MQWETRMTKKNQEKFCIERKKMNILTSLYSLIGYSLAKCDH